MMAKPNQARVVIIGDITVGKTSLLLRFTKGSFSSEPVRTIKSDFMLGTIFVGDQQVQLEIRDTAGQERYRSLTSGFFRGTNGVILMFDVTNRSSYLALNSWIREIDYHNITRNKCLLVGNKTDLKNKRVVEDAEAMALAQSLGLNYMEMSVKDNSGVEQAFDTLARQMMDHILETESQVQFKNIVLNQQETKIVKDKCVC